MYLTAYQIDNLPGSIERLKTAIAAGDGEAVASLGAYFSGSDRHQEAVELYHSAALTLDPKFYLIEASAAQGMNDLARAESAFQAAIAAGVEFDRDLYGDVIAERDPKRGAEFFERLAASNPEYFMSAGDAWRRTYWDDPELSTQKAEAAYRSARHAGISDAADRLGDLLAPTRPQEAIRFFEEAGHFSRAGNIYEAHGDLQQAEAAYRAGAAGDDTFDISFAELTRLLGSQARWAEVGELYEGKANERPSKRTYWTGALSAWARAGDEERSHAVIESAGEAGVVFHDFELRRIRGVERPNGDIQLP